jgi:hypothetical protein
MFGTKYGTRGTLRPTKPAESFEAEFQRIEREMNILKHLVIAAMVVIFGLSIIVVWL